MPSCETRYFGPTEFQDIDTISFPAAIPGFPGETRFVLLHRPAEYPLVYLQSIATADLCFLALPVFAIDNRYKLQISPDDARLIGTATEPAVGSEALCLALVSVWESGPTANLFAPLVVNLATRSAAQCINCIDYSHRHPLAVTEGVAA